MEKYMENKTQCSNAILMVLIFSFEAPYIFATTFRGSYKHIYIDWVKGTPTLTVHVTFSKLTLKQYLTPYKDYFYIPSQDQLIHRSLANFIPSSEKRKVTREECALIKTDYYISLFTTHKLTTVVWYDDLHTAYLRVEDFSSAVLTTQLFSLFFSSSTNKKHAS